MFLSSNLFVQWIANPTKGSPRCKRGLVGDISAAKVFADSIRGHVYTMDENSKFIGESKFQNSVKIQENLLIGENANNETSEKFEVRGGNAKFDGDVNIMGSVKITSIYDNLNGYPPATASVPLVVSLKKFTFES